MGEFAGTRQVTARNSHRCDECFRAIAPGESYERAAGSWEGDFWTLKTCAHCAAFRLIIDDVDTEFREYMYGGVHAWVDSTGSEPMELATYCGKHPRYTALSLHRWSRQFTTRWHDGTDPIPTVKEKADAVAPE